MNYRSGLQSSPAPFACRKLMLVQGNMTATSRLGRDQNQSNAGSVTNTALRGRRQIAARRIASTDAAGKDGVIRHLFTGMNPQGTFVFGFKQPSKYEAAHDFLWRAHLRTPGRGEVVIFNRSYYEDVLVVRVHKLVGHSVWSKRYDLIKNFEATLSLNGTTILKFFLHISRDEQLARFKQRLDDPSRRWKISESDYSERELWSEYTDAYEDAIALTSTKCAPWYVIPANHKWFRNLAVSQIIADTMDEMGLKLPPTRVDIADIRRKYHVAEREQGSGGR
jgi:PPK2 family polyphosphate:nucleotide phosphotransferase